MLTLGTLDIMEALSHPRYNIQYIFDKLPLGTVVTDSNGVIVYYNQAQSQIDGLEPEFALGKTEPEIYDFLNFPDIAKICRTRGRPILGFMWLYRTILGKTINAAYWVYPLFREREVIGAICFTQPLAASLSETTQAQERHPPIEWPQDTPIARENKKLLGGNLKFQQAVEITLSTAASPSPVLIAGETGTGKEMFARLVHESSPRRDKPFMAINCAAIPADLLEGLLFGTTRGGFTGATDRPGLFEEANGGVLYLDEIDSMPMELQPKLLRVLQEMRVRRIGSSVEKELDLKVISSVGTPVNQVLGANRLRRDLFYRLAVVVLELPALRDRLDDLDELANHFFNKYNHQLNKKCCKFSEALRARLLNYNWPGNVRELEHLVAGTINMAHPEDEVLDFRHLPLHYQRIFADPALALSPTDGVAADLDNGRPAEPGPALGPGPIHKAVAGTAAPRPNEKPSLKGRLGQNEIALLVQALTRSRGNVAKAARELGLSRQLLAYKMTKYGLERRRFLS